MPFPVVPVLAALAVASIGSGFMQAKQQQEAIKEQQKAATAKTRMETEQNRLAAVQTVRQARIKAAAIQAAAQNTGAQGSGEAGAVGSIASQTGQSIGQQNYLATGNQAITGMLKKASQFESKGLAWGAAKEGFGTIFSTVAAGSGNA